MTASTYMSVHLTKFEGEPGTVHETPNGRVGVFHLGGFPIYIHDSASAREVATIVSRLYNELLIAETDALTDHRAAIGLTRIEQESDRLEAKRQQEREARDLAALRAKLLSDGDDAA